MALAIHPIHRLMPVGRPGPGVASLAMLPFRLVAWVLFVDVKLKRAGKNLHIVTAVKPPVIAKPSPARKAIAEAAPLRQALKALLDLHPLTRQLMRHLGYLDRELATQGLKALAEVPVEVLATSLEQLDAIVDNWSDRHLADLRSRLAVAVKERSQDGFGNQLSDFATESRLLVDDVAHSEFEALERQYEGLVSPDAIQAALEAIRTPLPMEPAATTVTLINEVVIKPSPPSSPQS